MSVWPQGEVGTAAPTQDAPPYGGYSGAPTPLPQQPNPFGGMLPRNFPKYPQASDFRDLDNNYDSQGHLDAVDYWNSIASNLAEFDKYGFGGAAGAASGAGSAAAMAGVHAQNLSTFADATISKVAAEIEAGRLNLDQAQAEFDRRMDAFSEAGTQMAAQWQWTVPEGQAGKPLHSDIRSRLDMKPWISQAVEFDPFGEAMEIVEQTPEISVTPIDTAPIGEAVDLARQFV